MGLLKGMLEEVWRALCIASSALQVGIGQLNFNEVHSKVCSSAWAFERGSAEWEPAVGGGRGRRNEFLMDGKGGDESLLSVEGRGRGYPDTVMPTSESSNAGSEVVDMGWRIWGRSTNVGHWRP